MCCSSFPDSNCKQIMVSWISSSCPYMLSDKNLLRHHRHKVLLYFWMVTIMVLSLLLAIAVFLQCTPVQSIWDPRIEGTCTLSLTIIAKVMCCKFFALLIFSIMNANILSSLVRSYGFFPRSISLGSYLESQYEEKGKDHNLRLLEFGNHVSSNPNLHKYLSSD